MILYCIDKSAITQSRSIETNKSYQPTGSSKQEKSQMTQTSKIIACLLFAVINQHGVDGSGIFRALTGSNCIVLERGSAPLYYKCLGCVTEEAMGCLDDLRFNRTGNVPSSCDFARITEYYEAESCCPKFGKDHTGRTNLLYMGAAYPETLQCLINVGCQDSPMFTQLLEECNGICNPLGIDPRGTGAPNFGSTPGNVCTALYNAAPSNRQMSMGSVIMSIAVVILLSCFQTWHI